MTFNIEWGGDHVSFDRVVEAVRRARVDVVAVQEPEGNLDRLAEALGWHHDPRAYVVSRFPLLDPPGAEGGWSFVEVVPGGVVAIASVHLPSEPYGPSAALAGASRYELLEIERATRMPSIEPLLAVLAPMAASGMPVFIAGDFNAPSHADWVDSTVGLRPQIRMPLEWPVSRALEAAGFVDAWRNLRPDPVASPGLTWWAGRPPIDRYRIDPAEPRDRIDQIWVGGEVEPTGVELVGEPGVPEVGIEVEPWPSDHRAVVVSAAVVPHPLPILVTTDRRWVHAGEPIEVIAHGPGELSLERVGATAGSDTELLTATVGTGIDRQHPPPPMLTAGRYRVTLRAPGHVAQHRTFEVRPRGAEPVVDVPGARYGVGEPVEIDWAGAPGNRNDYVAIYVPGVKPRAGAEVAWAYIGGEPSGSLRLDDTTAGAGWPLPPGTYQAHLLEDDGYRILATSAPFVVREDAE